MSNERRQNWFADQGWADSSDCEPVAACPLAPTAAGAAVSGLAARTGGVTLTGLRRMTMGVSAALFDG